VSQLCEFAFAHLKNSVNFAPAIEN